MKEPYGKTKRFQRTSNNDFKRAVVFYYAYNYVIQDSVTFFVTDTIGTENIIPFQLRDKIIIINKYFEMKNLMRI